MFPAVMGEAAPSVQASGTVIDANSQLDTEGEVTYVTGVEFQESS
jgi:hypothetical protein